MKQRPSKDYWRIVQELTAKKSEIRLMGLNDLMEFAGAHWEYRNKALKLIQPLLQDPEEVIQMVAVDSLKKLREEVKMMQINDAERKKLYKEQIERIRKVRINKKDMDELEKKIQSYEGKSRFLALGIILSFMTGSALISVPGGIIPAVVLLVVSCLLVAYYLRFIRQLTKLREQIVQKSR